MFPPGRSSRPRLPLHGNGRRGPGCQDDVGLQANQFPRERVHPIDVIAVQPTVHPHVAAIDPTEASKRLNERRNESLPHRIVFVARHKHADAPHVVALL